MSKQKGYGIYYQATGSYDTTSSYKGPLKPCPFCGSDELLMNVEGVYDFNYYVECTHCTAIGPVGGETRQEAAAGWNRRQL